MLENANRLALGSSGRRHLFGVGGAVIAGLVLTACSAPARPIGPAALEGWKPPVADFRLSTVRVKWLTPKSLPYRVSYMVRASSTDKSLPPSVGEAAEQSVKHLLQLFGSELEPRLTQALLRQGVAKGDACTVTVVPLAANVSEKGWGNGMAVKVWMACGAAKPWSFDLMSRVEDKNFFGTQAPLPDAKLVDNLVDEFVKLMSKVGAFPSAVAH